MDRSLRRSGFQLGEVERLTGTRHPARHPAPPSTRHRALCLPAPPRPGAQRVGAFQGANQTRGGTRCTVREFLEADRFARSPDSPIDAISEMIVRFNQ